MAWLPISGKTYFSDFAFYLLNYDVERNSKIITTMQGLAGKDEDGRRKTHCFFNRF